jgi:transcriptional regulator with XRE-family HTH domain
MYKEALGSRLKHMREQWSFTQDYVAEELKIAQPTLACWEKGRRHPDVEMLGMLADLYEVSTDWLLGTKGGNDNLRNIPSNKESNSVFQGRG